MASTYLRRTSFGTPTEAKKFTISFWFKRTGLGSKYLMGCYDGSSTNSNDFVFSSGNALSMYFGGNAGSGYLLQPNRLFRDTNAWYHLVYEVDTTQATDSNRVKIYINGEQETSFSTTQYPPQNATTFIFNSVHNNIGQNWNATSNAFDGSISHFHFIDGTAYDADTFGEIDATTGEWKIKTSPSVTYGTNGFFILKDGNSVTDQSGNSNNFSITGTLTKTEDCPSNVFATLNPLLVSDNGTSIASKFSNGNTKHNGDSAGWRTSVPTLLPSTGKWYCEVKGSGCMIGVVGEPNIPGLVLSHMGTGTYGWGYEASTGRLFNTNSYTDNWGASYGSSDIMGIAYDADNKKLYMHKNGTYQNSGVPTSGATGTGAISLPNNREYYFAFSPADNTSYYCEVNFGNGYFGTTAVSSAGTNASGIGIFEHDVPNGYTALSTKGLNL